MHKHKMVVGFSLISIYTRQATIAIEFLPLLRAELYATFVLLPPLPVLFPTYIYMNLLISYLGFPSVIFAFITSFRVCVKHSKTSFFIMFNRNLNCLVQFQSKIILLVSIFFKTSSCFHVLFIFYVILWN